MLKTKTKLIVAVGKGEKSVDDVKTDIVPIVEEEKEEEEKEETPADDKEEEKEETRST